MLRENEFMIDNGTIGNRNFNTKLSFEVYTCEDNFEYDLEISCAEDVEEIMKLYFKKDWKTLFFDWDSRHNRWYKEVTDVGFEGIYIVAKEKGKGHVYMRIDSTQKVTVAVDLATMGDKNAAKLNEIRSIINK